METAENRKEKRIIHETDIQFKILGEDTARAGHGYRQAATKNISRGGLCVDVPFEMQKGNVLIVDLKLDIISAEINAISEVLWCRRVYGGYEAGVS
ncbi:MAG: PilZ domain-containing protein, partial [bacterium]